MTKDIAEAEDLTQEAFMQVFRGIGGFRGNSSFSTWLTRVAVNTVLTTFRRRRPTTLFSLDQLVSPDSTRLNEFGRRDLALSGVIDRIALRSAIRKLPNGCRTIFSLHDIEGYEHREIAQLLNCSIGTSKSQLHRARLKMRDLLFPEKKRGRRCATVPGSQELIPALP
jgi:RNA polymerase sigma-70 factor (ECF subfamily)